MTMLAERMPMARPKGRPKVSERNDRTARVDATILGWAEMVARAKGISLAEYLSETLRGPVAKDFAKVMEQMKGEK
jgi:hypothetical protein